jgi:hypothetical protein
VIAVRIPLRPRRIDGYAIVSEDGMLANEAGIMPDSLKFEADRQFFERELDGVEVVVHGRHSHEQQPAFAPPVDPDSANSGDRGRPVE